MRLPDIPGAPWLLDAFSGAGGAAKGYYQAGFNVIGVDIAAQPRYPFRFVQADALDALAHWDLSRFAAIHASPPCQRYSAARTMTPITRGKDYPDLLPAVQAILRARAVQPWVIENVAKAPMRADIVLCGTMFGLEIPGAQLRRHRIFEVSGFWAITAPCSHYGRALGVYGNGGGQRRHDRYGDKATAQESRDLMGIDWMQRRELAEAVPPAYTLFIGEQIMTEYADKQALM